MANTYSAAVAMQQKTLLILLTFLVLDAASQSELMTNTRVQCSYERSVKVQSNLNGSYMYQDLEIPPELVNNYNYTIIDNGTKIDAVSNIRACICEIKRCLRTCSKSLVDFYHNFDQKDIIDDGFTKNIKLINGTIQKLHLIHDFHLLPATLCVRSFPFEVERNPDMQWLMFENGTLYRQGDHAYLSPEQYCFDVDLFTEDNEVYFLITPINCDNTNLSRTVTRNAYALCYSLTVFIITIIFYCRLPYLRNVYGKCFISYLGSLSAAYILMIFQNLPAQNFPPTRCQTIGFTVYYTNAAYFMWTCLLSYDTWNSLTHVVAKSSFVKYSIVGWSVPLLVTALAYIAQISNIHENLKPGIKYPSCGINVTRWSVWVYAYVPSILSLIYCFVLYIQVVLVIHRRKRKIGAHKTVGRKPETQSCAFYIRLFLCMEVSLVFEIAFWLSYSIRLKYIGIPDILNTFQGTVIFLMFIFRPQLIKDVKNLLKIKSADREVRGRLELTNQSSSRGTLYSEVQN